MDSYRVERDGDLDLKFDGEKIGTGEHGTGGTSGYSGDWTRGTDVTIYLTEAGSIITAVTQWSRWDGEGSLHRAAIHSTPADALAWLVRDCGGSLGPASKKAWENACEHKALSDADVEHVA